jgi:uncharacterized membrane protein (DUF2068 family)
MRLPFWVIVVAILFLVGGLFSVLWGFVQATTGSVGWLAGLITFSESVRGWGGTALWHGLVGIIGGIVQIVVGFGLLAAQRWAWIIALVLSAIWLVAAVLALFSGNVFAIFGMIVPGFCLVVLLSTRARQAFQQEPTVR